MDDKMLDDYSSLQSFKFPTCAATWYSQGKTAKRELPSKKREEGEHAHSLETNQYKGKTQPSSQAETTERARGLDDNGKIATTVLNKVAEVKQVVTHCAR